MDQDQDPAEGSSKAAVRLSFSWRWRLLAAFGVLVLGWAAATLAGAPPAARGLIGWNLGAAAYLGLTWRLFLTSDAEAVRRHAAGEDETRWGLLGLVVGAILASLVGIVLSMMASKQGGAFEQNLVAGLALLTLVVSWLTLQTVFTLHYAHRHFSLADETGKVERGFLFPGDPASTYLDFVYLSFCIGATFQVSDTSVERASLRNLITAHGAVAYLYNTMILALGINILSGLVGH